MEVSLIKVASPVGGKREEVSKLKLLCLQAKTMHVLGDIWRAGGRKTWPGLFVVNFGLFPTSQLPSRLYPPCRCSPAAGHCGRRGPPAKAWRWVPAADSGERPCTSPTGRAAATPSTARARKKFAHQIYIYYCTCGRIIAKR